MTTTTKLERHSDAVLQAEVRRLTRALRPFGILDKDALARRACASSWHEGTFERALKTAIDAGEIEPLPLGFYRWSGSTDGRAEARARARGSARARAQRSAI